MTALLEFKQKIKGFYAKYEMYLQPLNSGSSAQISA